MVEPYQKLEINAEKFESARKKINKNDPPQLADFFKLLAGETRIKILLALSVGELCVYDLSKILKMSISAVSHQLRELRQGRFVKYRRTGKENYYSLEIEHLQPILAQALEHIHEE